MERHAVAFSLRCDERLHDGASARDRDAGTIGVSSNTRFRSLLREVARAVHGRGNARARELRSMSDEALRGALHVSLVIPGESGERKRLTIDESTVFSKILSSHAPSACGRGREAAYFLVSRRVSKSERRASAKAGAGAGSKRADARSGEGKPASNSVSVISVAKSASGEATEAKKSPSPSSPKPSSASTTWANKVGSGAQSVSPGRSPNAANAANAANTGRRSLGPLTSQARRTARREKERAATAAAAEADDDALVANFAQSKIRDPVVFPAFRRSAQGAIGDPYPSTVRRDALTASPRSHPR